MRKQATFTVVLGCLLAGAASGGELRVLENTIEASTTTVSLPTAAPSTMIVRGCPTCKTTILRVEARSRFLIANNEAVSAAELRSICGTRAVDFTIAFEPATKVVTRVITDCVRPAVGRQQRK